MLNQLELFAKPPRFTPPHEVGCCNHLYSSQHRDWYLCKDLNQILARYKMYNDDIGTHHMSIHSNTDEWYPDWAAEFAISKALIK